MRDHRSTRYPDNANVRSLDVIAAHLRAAGIPNVTIEQTGGGTATLYAGAITEQPDYGPRYALVAGPGWFEPHWSAPDRHAFVSLDDFYVGPDDDGDTQPDAITSGTNDEIAAVLLKRLRSAPPLP